MLTRLPHAPAGTRPPRRPPDRPPNAASGFTAIMSPCRPPRTSACPVPRATDTPRAEVVEEGVLSNLPRTPPQRTTERRIASREGETRRRGLPQHVRRRRRDGPRARPSATAAAKANGAAATATNGPPRHLRAGAEASPEQAQPKRPTRAASARKPRKAPSRARRQPPSVPGPSRRKPLPARASRANRPAPRGPRPAPGRRRAAGRRRGDRRRGGQGRRVGRRAGPEGPVLAASPLARSGGARGRRGTVAPGG